MSIRVTDSSPTRSKRTGTTKLRATGRGARGTGPRATRRCACILDAATRNGSSRWRPTSRRLWDDPSTSNRERKRLLAHVVEDATLVKSTADRHHHHSCPLHGRQDRDAHDAEPEVLGATGQDTTRNRERSSTNSSTTIPSTRSQISSMPADSNPADQHVAAKARRASTQSASPTSRTVTGYARATTDSERAGC